MLDKVSQCLLHFPCFGALGTKQTFLQMEAQNKQDKYLGGTLLKDPADTSYPLLAPLFSLLHLSLILGVHEMKWDLPSRVPRMTLHFVLCMKSLI